MLGLFLRGHQGDFKRITQVKRQPNLCILIIKNVIWVEKKREHWRYRNSQNHFWGLVDCHLCNDQPLSWVALHSQEMWKITTSQVGQCRSWSVKCASQLQSWNCIYSNIWLQLTLVIGQKGSSTWQWIWLRFPSSSVVPIKTFPAASLPFIKLLQAMKSSKNVTNG